MPVRRRTRQAILAIGLGLAALLLVVLGQALSFASRQVAVDPGAAIAVDVAEAAARLGRAIRFRTVSHPDPAQVDGAEFLRFHDYLGQAFPRAHRALEREVVGRYSLLYTWPGTTMADPLLFVAHLDVVPAGVEADWTHPPFAGRIADGYVWGRGAMDHKVSVLALLEAVELLVAQGFTPRRTLHLAFGHDEEVGGSEGAAAMARLLRARRVRPRYLLDEGGVITDGIVAGVAAPVALVGIAEKGYLDVELTVTDVGGHASRPPAHTAIGLLSAAIRRLEQQPMPRRLAGVARQTLTHLGPEMSFPERALVANLWLFGPLVEWRLAASAEGNAAIRTTLAPTLFEAGDRNNVLPTRARAVVNVRILPGDTIADVLDHVRRAIDDPRVHVRPLAGASEPSPVSSASAPSFEVLARTIRQTFPGVVVAPYLTVATTDSRHYATLGASVYRFVPLRAGPGDLRRVHGPNERIAVADYGDVVRFYARLIRSSDP